VPFCVLLGPAGDEGRDPLGSAIRCGSVAQVWVVLADVLVAVHFGYLAMLCFG